ncbi:hypothetical protein ACJX0J_019037 [Zea mays]
MSIHLGNNNTVVIAAQYRSDGSHGLFLGLHILKFGIINQTSGSHIAEKNDSKEATIHSEILDKLLGLNVQGLVATHAHRQKHDPHSPLLGKMVPSGTNVEYASLTFCFKNCFLAQETLQKCNKSNTFVTR